MASSPTTRPSEGVGTGPGKRSIRGGGLKPAVDRDFSRADPQADELRNGSGQQRVLLGLPIWCEAGRINPRAPDRVYSVTSASWLTYPNSFGYPDVPIAQPVPILPFRIGRASGSASDTIRSVIFFAREPLTDLPGNLLATAVSSSKRRAAASFARAPRPRALRRAIRASRRIDAAIVAAGRQPAGTLMLRADRLTPADLANEVLAVVGARELDSGG